MKALHWITRGALLVGLASASTDAQANDGKVYPGAVCQHVVGGEFGYWNGTVRNLNTRSDMYVICPFVRDSGRIDAANMQVFDRKHDDPDGNDDNVWCSLRYERFSDDEEGVPRGQQMRAESSGYGTRSQTVTFTPEYGLDGGAYYYAWCFIPRAEELPSGEVIHSHIVHFGILEPD